MFEDSVSAFSIRQLDNIDVRGVGEEAFGLWGKEQEANVFRLHIFIVTVDDIHAPAEINKIHVVCLVEERAFDLVEIRFYKCQVQVCDAGGMIDTIVEGNVVGQVVEIRLFLMTRLDGACHLANPMDAIGFPAHALRRRIRPLAAAWRPYQDECLAFVSRDFRDGHIGWLYELALIEHILEPDIGFRCRHAYEFMSSGILTNANDNISPAPIVDIVGKGADGLEGCLRIPGLFELYAFPFDCVAFEKRLDVCGQCHNDSSIHLISHLKSHLLRHDTINETLNERVDDSAEAFWHAGYAVLPASCIPCGLSFRYMACHAF